MTAPSKLPPKPMKERDDIVPEDTWVVSDTHFGHDNIVGFCHRPEDHEQVMIAEWRAYVPDYATVLHLGDLCYRGNARFKHLIAKELTGERKLIIMGNHDHQRFSFYKQSGFTIARPFYIDYPVPGTALSETCFGCDRDALNPECEFCHGTGVFTMPALTTRVSFSHYPWNEEEDGGPMPSDALRVHGHIHNNGYSRDAFVPFLRQHINLSVEQMKYRPVNLAILLDAYLGGVYPETTQEQLDEARDRKVLAKAGEL